MPEQSPNVYATKEQHAKLEVQVSSLAASVTSLAETVKSGHTETTNELRNIRRDIQMSTGVKPWMLALAVTGIITIFSGATAMISLGVKNEAVAEIHRTYQEAHFSQLLEMIEHNDERSFARHDAQSLEWRGAVDELVDRFETWNRRQSDEHHTLEQSHSETRERLAAVEAVVEERRQID